ncbi:hypothetical protein [Paraburkholderia terricola]|uniref:Uncharacterized protein n=1 Tax=Paraburkholderia terricola TaxID=169427 RepID=A0ABU1LX14_9BURK|nr:hypothetical protein [Paraburkholderia terricola]MDR6411295.1 hypothetical protein [Paraburkholderia terricola]MDR6483465.1 hypothetical protein [Paraburkholderia terricola]
MKIYAGFGAALHGANAMAFEFFRQKGESFPLREAENLVVLTANRLRGG